jgi:hypothetical protein
VNYLKVRFHDINKGKGPSHIIIARKESAFILYP